jgi:indolepyruvate ferredoxin oxidoreductase beta subunit
MKAFNILHCGVGGQGVVMMANIIGLACARSGLKVNSGELHGLSQRSGSVIAHQRIGQDVYSPLIPYGEADVVMALEPMEALRYAYFLKNDGSVITNTNIIHPPIETQRLALKQIPAYVEYPAIIKTLEDAGFKVLEIDALALASQAGNPQAENVVLVGAISGSEGFPVPKEQMISAVRSSVPEKALEANLRAFDLGYSSVARLLQKI